MITTKTVNGVQIAFDDQGHEPGPVFVTLSGWAHDLRAYDGMLPYLRAAQRTVRVCWRGHGPDRNLVGDFGIDEMAADTIGLLDALEVDSFVPIAHAHGGWAALEIADRLGAQRVPAVMILDLIMTPAPPEFVTALHGI